MSFRVQCRLIVAASLLATACTAAAAQSTNDVRCLMASNLFSRAAKDPKARTVAEAAKFFYLGRIAGRLSEQQVRAQMRAQMKTLTRANAGNVMSTCMGQMKAPAAMVERVGKELAPRKK